MPSILDPQGLRLRLNAQDVQSLTGWPDAMVSDYLEILNNLYEYALAINSNTIDMTQIEIQKNPVTTPTNADVGYTRAYIEDDFLKGIDSDGTSHTYGQEVFLGAPSSYPSHAGLVFNQVTISGQNVYQLQVYDGTP